MVVGEEELGPVGQWVVGAEAGRRHPPSAGEWGGWLARGHECEAPVLDCLWLVLALPPHEARVRGSAWAAPRRTPRPPTTTPSCAEWAGLTLAMVRCVRAPFERSANHKATKLPADR